MNSIINVLTLALPGPFPFLFTNQYYSLLLSPIGSEDNAKIVVNIYMPRSTIFSSSSVYVCLRLEEYFEEWLRKLHVSPEKARQYHDEIITYTGGFDIALASLNPGDRKVKLEDQPGYQQVPLNLRSRSGDTVTGAAHSHEHDRADPPTSAGSASEPLQSQTPPG